MKKKKERTNAYFLIYIAFWKLTSAAVIQWYSLHHLSSDLYYCWWIYFKTVLPNFITETNSCYVVLPTNVKENRPFGNAFILKSIIIPSFYEYFTIFNSTFMQMTKYWNMLIFLFFLCMLLSTRTLPSFPYNGRVLLQVRKRVDSSDSY